MEQTLAQSNTSKPFRDPQTTSPTHTPKILLALLPICLLVVGAVYLLYPKENSYKNYVLEASLTYEIQGTLEKVDKQTLYLKTPDGKVFSFRLGDRTQVVKASDSAKLYDSEPYSLDQIIEGDQMVVVASLVNLPKTLEQKIDLNNASAEVPLIAKIK